MRITESQLRRIIRQEVHRARITEMAASRSTAQLVFDEYMLADAGGAFGDPRATVKSLTKKAESMGLTASPDAMGTGLTVSGDPRTLKRFANELEIDYAGGAQSAPSGEESLASMIEYI